MTQHSYLRIHPKDNVLVALRDLEQGTPIEFEGLRFNLADKVAAKHKFTFMTYSPMTLFLCTGYWWARQQNLFRRAD